MKHDTGGPAYPLVLQEKDEEGRVSPVIQGGMTLLDYFAGEAMEAIYISGDHKKAMDNYTPGEPEPIKRDCNQHEVAAWAYGVAEAMIAEKRRREE